MTRTSFDASTRVRRDSSDNSDGSRETSCASRGSPPVTWSVYQRFGVEGWSHGLAGDEYYSAASSESKSLFPLTWGGVVWC
jgi:hypothetical protein